MPERPKGAGCKPAGSAYEGSNPSPCIGIWPSRRAPTLAARAARLPPPALLAQLVEHLHGKEGVDGSSPSEGLKYLQIGVLCRLRGRRPDHRQRSGGSAEGTRASRYARSCSRIVGSRISSSRASRSTFAITSAVFGSSSAKGRNTRP